MIFKGKYASGTIAVIGFLHSDFSQRYWGTIQSMHTSSSRVEEPVRVWNTQFSSISRQGEAVLYTLTSYMCEGFLKPSIIYNCIEWWIFTEFCPVADLCSQKMSWERFLGDWWEAVSLPDLLAQGQWQADDPMVKFLTFRFLGFPTLFNIDSLRVITKRKGFFTFSLLLNSIPLTKDIWLICSVLGSKW